MPKIKQTGGLTGPLTDGSSFRPVRCPDDQKPRREGEDGEGARSAEGGDQVGRGEGSQISRDNPPLGSEHAGGEESPGAYAGPIKANKGLLALRDVRSKG